MSSISRLLYRSFCTSLSSTVATTPKAPTIDSIVDSIFKERNLTKLVEKFKQSSEIYRFRSKHKIYQIATRRLASAKQFDSIEEILEQQKKYHDITKEGFAIRLIKLYGNAGMFDHASKTFDELPELKCERTVKSFNALLSACVDSKKYDKVEKLFRNIPLKLSITPDEYSYTITIQALCLLEELDSAVSLLDEMETKGLKPNLVTFNTLLNMFYEAGRILEAERIWARMEKKEIVPDIRSYNAKLKGLVVKGKISEAEKLLGELRTKEPKADTFSFNVLIKSYCNDGKYDDAKRVYDELLADGHKENRWTYEALIPVLCEKGDFDFALKLCKKSLGLNCYLSAGILQVVVDGLVKQSKVNDANELVELARSKSYGRKSLKLPSEDE
ncbi:hypothetical protein AQUCO_00500380v1 [Aquilegia coerulea]|uniref:Pentacotripeptide-repeat region of PRORP domain-containing protein n=1 Tax=Aquilegia coerulea TaxID=218851 RepID=A0A2G5ERP5_AQUCA|nr:hypothetical protein AQUCO_00500380v1 [Aquilegia coerulea]